jgi:mycothiol synthase
MSVTFRRFAREDLNPLLELINQANQMDGAGWFFTGIDLLDALLKDEPIPAKDRIWLATDGDMLAGYYRLASEWVQDGLKATCYGCVHPTYRRLGIGTRLIQHALAITDQHRPQPKHLLFQVPARRSVAGIYALCEQNGLTMARQFNVLKRNAHLALNNCHTRWDGQIKPFELKRDAVNLQQGFLVCFPTQSMSIKSLQMEWEKAHKKAGKWFVAYGSKSELCGFCLATIEKEEEKEAIGLIDYLGVLPAARRQGLGRMLLFETIQYFQASGLSEIKLATEVDNLNALNLYYDAGFKTWREARLYQIELLKKLDGI